MRLPIVTFHLSNQFNTFTLFKFRKIHQRRLFHNVKIYFLIEEVDIYLDL